MKKTFFAVFSGFVAFAATYVLVPIGVYIKCFFNNINFSLPAALDGNWKQAVLAGVVIFLLQLLAGTRKP